MFNHYLYKLFNPDLNNLNKNQLLKHWNNYGYKENRINSLESFFKIYPYYNHNEYKLYNKDIIINDTIELMIHWHFIGKKNRICSSKYFHFLYPNVDIDKMNINTAKHIIDFKSKIQTENIEISQ